MMTSVISLLLVALASMAFFDVDVEARPSMLEVRSPLGGHEAEVDDALKYLVELDKYYSQVARPRERRVGQTMASALEKLSQIKNYYNEAGRPRFGKRSAAHPLESLIESFKNYKENNA